MNWTDTLRTFDGSLLRASKRFSVFNNLRWVVMTLHFPIATSLLKGRYIATKGYRLFSQWIVWMRNWLTDYSHLRRNSHVNHQFFNTGLNGSKIGVFTSKTAFCYEAIAQREMKLWNRLTHDVSNCCLLIFSLVTVQQKEDCRWWQSTAAQRGSGAVPNTLTLP